MSTATYGPRTSLDGPLPIAPPHSLLRAAQTIDEPDLRFLNGADIWAYPSEKAQLWAPCSEGSARDKGVGDDIALPRFGAFVAYLPIHCTRMGVGDSELEARASAQLTAVESEAVARELATGEIQPGNPFLGDASADLLNGGAATTPGVALAFLEDAIGATGKAGLIHATPSVAAAWSALGNAVVERGGKLFTTGSGTPIAVDGGYIGADPASGASPAAGQSWAFASGPVQIRRGPVEQLPGFEREVNDVVIRAERSYLVVWDGALQAAVLVDWTP